MTDSSTMHTNLNDRLQQRPFERPLTPPDFTKGGGLITVVAQDVISGAVLMVAHMDQEAYEKTLETGEMHYRSRTRGLWHKGATSGNVQIVHALLLDCDNDTLLARVTPAGPACHTGSTTCFGPSSSTANVVQALDGVIAQRREDALQKENPSAVARPQGASSPPSRSSYTQRLFDDRNLRLKKLGEEIAELVVALCDHDRGRIAEEGADVLYHTLVALHAEGVQFNDVQRVLFERSRSKPS